MAISFGTGGGSGKAFSVGTPDNIFGETSGNISSVPLSVSPAQTRAAALTLLTDYGTANPSWLQGYDDRPTEGVFIFYISNFEIFNEGLTRVNGQWVNNTSLVAFQGLPGSGVDFSNLPENAILAVGPGPDKLPLDSGGRVLSDGTSFFSKFAVASESIDVGEEVVLTDNAGTVGYRRNSDGMARILPAVKITPEGYESAIRAEAKELITIGLNTVETESNTGSTIVFDYDGDFEFIADRLYFRSNAEIDNFQLTIYKEVDGQFKSIRKLVPETNYNEGSGAFVVDSMPAEPDPKAVYYIRDTNTGEFTITIQEASVVEVDGNDDPIPYRIELKTTNAFDLKGVTANLGYGSMFYPYLRATGHDTSRIALADARDVLRIHRDVVADRILDTLNDLYTNRSSLFEYKGDHTVHFKAPANVFREGESIKLRMNGGRGVLKIDGFTINGASQFQGQDNHTYLVVYEDADGTDWQVIDITGENYDIAYLSSNSILKVEKAYAIDTSGGSVTLTVDVNSIDAFSVFDATESFGDFSCFIAFGGSIGTIELDRKNDSFEFYKKDDGSWMYRELDQDEAGAL